MRSNQEISQYIEDNRVIPNVLHFFLSRFSYEEAKVHLKKEVTEKMFKDEVAKSEEGLDDFMNKLRNSISSIFIGLANDLLMPQARIIDFLHKVLFLKQFLWFDELIGITYSRRILLNGILH